MKLWPAKRSDADPVVEVPAANAAVIADAEAQLESANALYERERQALEGAEAAAGLARAKYVDDDANEATGAEFDRTRAEMNRAEVRVEAARAKVATATARLQTAKNAAANAKRAEELEAFRDEASLDKFYERIEPAWDDLLVHAEGFLDAVERVRTAYLESCSASAKLRGAGELVRDIDPALTDVTFGEDDGMPVIRI